MFQPGSDRLLVFLAAGNPATVQTVDNRVHRDLDPETEAKESEPKDARSCLHLFEAAEYVGQVSVAVQQKLAAAMQQAGTSAEASFILGGPIGESKDGKPPLDNGWPTKLSLEDQTSPRLTPTPLRHCPPCHCPPPFHP